MSRCFGSFRFAAAVAVVGGLLIGFGTGGKASASGGGLPGFGLERTWPTGYGPVAVAVDPSTQTVDVTDWGQQGTPSPPNSGDVTTFSESGTQSTIASDQSFEPEGGVADQGDFFFVSSHLNANDPPGSGLLRCPNETGTPVARWVSGTAEGTFHLPSATSTVISLNADLSTRTLYALDCFSRAVDVISEASALAGGNASAIGLGGTPYDVAVDSTNHNVYVALGTGGIVVIDESGDANTGKVVQTIAYTAYSLAVDSTSHALYAFGGTATTFAIIDESGDANTGKVVAQPQIAGGDVIVATAAVADPSTHFLYLSGEDLTQDTVTGWVFDEANDGHTGQSAPGSSATHWPSIPRPTWSLPLSPQEDRRGPCLVRWTPSEPHPAHRRPPAPRPKTDRLW